MKKVGSLFLVGVILVSLCIPIVAAELDNPIVVPESAERLTTSFNSQWMIHSIDPNYPNTFNVHSGSQYFLRSLGYGQAGEVLPVFNFGHDFKQGYTYYIKFSISNGNTSYINGSSTLFSSNVTGNLVKNDYLGLVPLNSVCDLSYFVNITPPITNMQFILHFTEDYDSAAKLLPQFTFAFDGNGSVTIGSATCQAYEDTDMSVYDQIMLTIMNSLSLDITQLRQAVIDQSNEEMDLWQQLHNELINKIEGNDSESVDNSTLANDISDYQDAEDAINEALPESYEVDGVEFSISPDLFDQLDSFVAGLTAPQYEVDVGDQFRKIWDLIFSYLAVPILLTLTLGVALAFLKGRARA